MNKRRIALVGTAPSSVHAPFGDPSWEIWGVGARAEHVTRADRWYEIHRLSGKFKGAELLDWQDSIKEWSKESELWMFYPQDLPGHPVKQFPMQRIGLRFGTYFMTSTFSWMMAHAIDELRPKDGASVPGEIGLWGVDMEQGSEYRHQRAGLRHFVDLAHFVGIEVTRLASGGVVYEPTPYPFFLEDPLLEKTLLRQRALTAEKAKREEVLRVSRLRMSQIKAINGELEGVLKAAAKVGHIRDRLAKLERERAGMEAKLPQLQLDVAWAEGSLAENEHLQDYIKP